MNVAGAGALGGGGEGAGIGNVVLCHPEGLPGRAATPRRSVDNRSSSSRVQGPYNCNLVEADKRCEFLVPPIISPVIQIYMLPNLLIMMQRNAIKLLKRIHDILARRRQSGIKGHALRQPIRAQRILIASCDIDALGFLDVAEVDGVDRAPLVRDHGGLHVTDKSPLRGAEEGVGFDV